MQRDGGPERRAVRRQAVPVVRCRRLCENGTAAARLFAAPQLTLFWRMTEIAPVVVCSVLCLMLIVCNESNN